MKINDDQHLLFIEPEHIRSFTPVNDELTEIMHKALLESEEFGHCKGWHTCSCGESSTNCDYRLKNGLITNSLCVHYLMWHRTEIPRIELSKVLMLKYA